jgi:hypothetical protein
MNKKRSVVEDHEEVVERVATVDVAKVSGKVCTRVALVPRRARRTATGRHLPALAAAAGAHPVRRLDLATGEQATDGNGRWASRRLRPRRYHIL